MEGLAERVAGSSISSVDVNGVSGQDAWREGPSAPQLNEQDVDVWLTGLLMSDAELAALARTLSGAELDRAGRFRRSLDRARFVARRGLLRAILARYVGVAPADIAYMTDAAGKPFLVDTCVSGMGFSTSSCDDLAVVAVARQPFMGIDIERVRPDVLSDALAAGVLSSAEAEALLRRPEPARTWDFFVCWTGKEAFAKAVGLGLSLGLDRVQTYPRLDIDASLFAGPAHLLRVPLPQPWSGSLCVGQGLSSVHWWTPGEWPTHHLVQRRAFQGHDEPARDAVQGSVE